MLARDFRTCRLPLLDQSAIAQGCREYACPADTRGAYRKLTIYHSRRLNFTEHQILAYQCAPDRFTGNALVETTDEYFYRDVVSVSTRTENLVLDKTALTRTDRKVLRAQLRGGELRIPSAEVFKLTTSGGTGIEVVMEVILDKLNSLIMDPGGSVQVSIADRAIAGIRQMLREKKMPLAGDTGQDVNLDFWQTCPRP
jgi:hypothetical protein